MPSKTIKPIFEKLEEIADMSALSPEYRAKYEQSLKVYHDYEAVMEAAELRGFEEGLKEGREKRFKEVCEEIARRMKAEGMDSNMIQECTELSIEEIEKL